MSVGDPAADIQRLRWRCRRGLLELDLLLQQGLERHYRRLSAQERAWFRELLATPDETLLGWIQHIDSCPREEFRSLLKLISQPIDYKY